MKRTLKRLLPPSLWTARFTAAWIVSVLLFLTWDVVWCAHTTFRAMSFAATWLTLLLSATAATLPGALAPRRPWIQLAVWLAAGMAAAANLMYFRTYFTAIPASSYLLAGNLHDFGASVADSLRLVDAAFILIPVAGYIALRRIKPAPVKFLPWCATAGTLAAGTFIATLPYGGLRAHVNHLTQQCYYTNCPPVVYGIHGKLIAELLTQTEPMTEGDVAAVGAWMLGHDILAHTDSTTVMPDSRRKVVVIFLESVESWPIGLSAEGREITPNLNRYAADSTSFFAPNVVTQVGNGRSIDAQLLTLAGLLPAVNEVYAMSRADNLYPSLIHALKEARPATRATLLTGDKATVWNQARVAAAFGIDSIIDAPHWRLTDRIGNPPKLSDEALFTQTVERCRRGDILAPGTPEFLQIVAYSSHNPWTIPAAKRNIDLKDSYPDKYADYLTAVNYVDRWLGTFVDYLRSRPDYYDIMVVIVGDHEGLATYRDRMPAAVDRRQHTPLIILNAPLPGRFDGEMGQVDVYPTLLRQLGLDGYGWRGLGLSAAPGDRHPGVAVDASGRLTDDGASPEVTRTLLDARAVSDRIIRFDMFRRNLPLCH